jgi:hypothetical protein
MEIFILRSWLLIPGRAAGSGRRARRDSVRRSAGLSLSLGNAQDIRRDTVERSLLRNARF